MRKYGRHKIRKYDSAAGKEQYEIFKATIRLIIRQVTARIKGTIIDLSNQSKKQIRMPLEGATHAVQQLSRSKQQLVRCEGSFSEQQTTK